MATITAQLMLRNVVPNSFVTPEGRMSRLGGWLNIIFKLFRQKFDNRRADQNLSAAAAYRRRRPRLVKSLVKQLNNSLTASPLFPDTGTPALGVVAKRAPSLRDILFSQRDICLDTSRGSVITRCTPLGTTSVGRPCESCDLMFEQTRLTIGQQNMNCAGGDCKSFNVNYCAQCSICNKAYIGKTAQQLGRRISQHRGQIQTINRDSIDDTNTLAAHTIKHIMYGPRLVLIPFIDFSF